MASKRRNRTADPSTKTGQLLQTMEVNGNVFFPCEICNRLFRREIEALEHFQICKPIDNSNRSMTDEVNKTINKSKKTRGNKKCKRNPLTLRKKANEDIPKQVRSIVKSCNNYRSVPKKRSIKDVESNVELNNITNKNGVVENKRKGNSKRKKNEMQIKEIAALPKKRGKKLSEEEIAERLKNISEKLKKKVEVKIPLEDEEEEERREIEDKLTALNKDSESAYFDDYPDFDDRFNDQDETCTSESKDSGESLVTDKRIENEHGVSNSISSNALRHSNTSEKSSGIIIVTQRPDGQLHGCPKCSEVFVSELELFRHKRAKHTSPKIIMAPDEIKKFYNVSDRSQCPICKKTLSSQNKSIYIKHLQSHSYIGEFECPICKKKFKRKDHMRIHEKRHIILC
ncbi:zinc finger protein 394-like [Harmonia axyridis]|uniref:zinc finger protein 394-like n=1 Tax=Harmonia axyridis TaxID=115357 RepID=UPI001E2770B3|nr:zinc finger protein 394-like [Harmonia axyridis]